MLITRFLGGLSYAFGRCKLSNTLGAREHSRSRPLLFTRFREAASYLESLCAPFVILVSLW